jgi:hypothetical protein
MGSIAMATTTSHHLKAAISGSVAAAVFFYQCYRAMPRQHGHSAKLVAAMVMC